MKRILLVFITLIIVKISYSAEPKDSLAKVIFSPNWTVQSQFAGYYVAKAMGFYEKQGLDVEIKHPLSYQNALNLLKEDKVDIAVLSFVDGLQQNDRDFEIKNLLQVIPRSTVYIISHKPVSGDIRNFDGMRIARWKWTYQTIMPNIFKKLNVQVEWIPYLTGVNLFLSKSVDAITVMSYNELQTIIETGYDINPDQLYSFESSGYYIPEDGLYAKNSYIKENPEIIEKFRKASKEGWEWAMKNPEKTVEIIMQKAEKHNISTNAYHQRKMLATLAEFGVASSNESFEVSEENFNKLVTQLLELEIIKEKVEYNNFIYQSNED